MSGSTPTYAFPYPTGTDLVINGDNAMQALAERVEAVNQTMRGWTKKAGAAWTIAGDSTWRLLTAVSLSGLPVGGVILAMGTMVASVPTAAGAFLQGSFQNPTGLNRIGGMTSPGVVKIQPPTANLLTAVTVFDMFVATAAAPDLNFYGFSNSGGTVTVDAETHLAAVRLY